MNPHAVDLEELEARVARRLASALSRVSEGQDHAISERLRVAREQAVLRAREARQAQAATAVHTAGGAAVLGGGWLGAPRTWLARAAMVLPAVMLAVGLLAIDQHHHQAQIEAVADVDLALLSDDVPPGAYGDAGFREYLRRTGATAIR